MDIDELVTPERVMGLDDAAKRLMRKYLTFEEIDQWISPRQRQYVIDRVREERATQERKKIAFRIHELGFDIPTIAAVTDLSVEQVRVLLSDDG